MKRNLGFALVLSTLGLGLAGLFLRRWQLDTAFEPASGLLTPHQPATVALIAVVALAAVLAVGLSAALFRGEAPKGYLANLAAPNLGVGLVTLLAGGLLFAGGVLGIRDYALRMDDRIVRLVLGICLAPTGIAVGLIGLLGQQRSEAKGRFHGALLAPGYCACVWLISAFQGHAANPNVMEYVFLLTGIVCVVFACYASASFSFEKPRPILCAAASAMGIVLLMVSAADHPWGMDLMTVLGFEVYLLAQLICLVSCKAHPPELEEWAAPVEDGEEADANEDQVQPRGEEDE